MPDKAIIADLDIEHSKCEVHQHKILDDNLYVKFNIITSDWDETNLSAIFNKSIVVDLLDDFTCKVPQEIVDLGSEFTIGLYGTNEGYIINTNNVIIKMFNNTYEVGELYNPYILSKRLKNRI